MCWQCRVTTACMCEFKIFDRFRAAAQCNLDGQWLMLHTHPGRSMLLLMHHLISIAKVLKDCKYTPRSIALPILPAAASHDVCTTFGCMSHTLRK